MHYPEASIRYAFSALAGEKTMCIGSGRVAKRGLSPIHSVEVGVTSAEYSSKTVHLTRGADMPV